MSVSGIAAISDLGLTFCSSSSRCISLATLKPIKLKFRSFARLSSSDNAGSLFTRRNKLQDLGILKSVQLDMFVTSDGEEEMSEGFFEAIEELERMVREPSDVLEELNDKLSTRELQLVLVYFAQEGRDSWCALEVFEWLKKENKVDKETLELMVSIMCTWVKKLIEGKNKVEDVVDLLIDMDCVGLKTNFSMTEKVISLYWEAGEKEGTVLFVKEVLRRGISSFPDGESEGNKGGPAGYLAWKMMVIANNLITMFLFYCFGSAITLLCCFICHLSFMMNVFSLHHYVTRTVLVFLLYVIELKWVGSCDSAVFLLLCFVVVALFVVLLGGQDFSFM